MNNIIVMTSINPPTKAVIALSKLLGYQFINVGDKKSPKKWNCDGVDYISINDQEKSSYSISKALPFNHYSRKMLGYLKAIDMGADRIIDIDDDNIPKPDWQFPEFNNTFECINKKGFINIYQLFTKQKIWPRGLPLDLINTDFELGHTIEIKKCSVGVWQGLADGNPDVDAIYRLTDDSPCVFDNRSPIVLAKGTICPFNSQNTVTRKELFPLLYLPAHVTFRFTDILRGLVAQPIMWLYGYQLGFTNATVVQERNPHDYMKDFISEIPMYKYSNEVVEIVRGSISRSESLMSNLFSAYESLVNASIVSEDELKTLSAWLKDLDKILT